MIYQEDMVTLAADKIPEHEEVRGHIHNTSIFDCLLGIIIILY